MNKRYSNILGTVGNTPVVKINHLAPEGVELYVKLESFNPMGSVKDRLALGVIEDAERRGILKPGQTIVEATSGNTGIGLAMVCAQKGYPLVIVMAENFSVERRKMMRFLGAKVILTPAVQKGTGMLNKALELAKQHGWWCPQQFSNPANADIHATTTAVEILNDFADRPLDYWVSGYGTGGTLNGVSRTLKAQSPTTKIMVCEPENAPLLANKIPQERQADGSFNGSHPSFCPHPIQGWTPDFISELVEQVTDQQHIDGFVPINGQDALQCARDLARKEGIFVGISAGATFSGALKVAQSAPKGSSILCMLPDTGERYLSTPLFDDIHEDMNEQEITIAQSTQGQRFDLPLPVPPLPAAAMLDHRAQERVQAYISDTANPVVIFGLQWCEFCWTVCKLFKQYGIDYVYVEIDSAANQVGEFGKKMREVIRDTTKSNSFPQIFIKGKFMGGCIDMLEACKQGKLVETLQNLQIPVDAAMNAEPYTFLPKWLHAR